MGNLTEKQQEAISTLSGYIRVVAGAGSGKTKTLTERFANIVQKQKAKPNEVMCVTFTNDAAKEMKNRINLSLGTQQSYEYLRTFHSFCCRFLREEISVLGISKNFKVIDTSDSEHLASKALELLDIKKSSGLTGKKAFNQIIAPVKALNDERYIDFQISHSLSGMWDEISNNVNHHLVDIHTEMGKLSSTDKKIMLGYCALQRENNSLDFEDLINFTLYILHNYPEIRTKWQHRIKYVQVDEFQDVNPKEFEIVAILSDYSKNLFVVGDPDQCIYSFRGANVNCIVKFDEILKALLHHSVVSKTIYLSENFRSSPQIVGIANSLIKNNVVRLDKSLIATRNNGLITEHHSSINPQSEAEWVAEEIHKLHDKEGYSYKDIAVLYRVNRNSRNFELAFMGKIPYRLVRGTAFYSRKEIKLLLAYLSVLVYQDNISLEHILGYVKGFGPKKMNDLRALSVSEGTSMYQTLLNHKEDKLYTKFELDKMITHLEELRELSLRPNLALSTFVRIIIRDFNIEEKVEKLTNEEDRLENISEFIQSMYDYQIAHKNEEISLKGYLEDISLLTTGDNSNAEEMDKVQLMTIHASKGLEFPVVFIVNAVEDTIPYNKSVLEGKIEEERRLFYVAITRAEDRLYITDYKSIEGNKTIFLEPSMFMSEIPHTLFKSNRFFDTADRSILSSIMQDWNTNIKGAFYRLTEEQVSWFIDVYRRLSYFCSLDNGYNINLEVQLKLLRFLSTLDEDLFKEWFDSISELNFKDIFDKELKVHQEESVSLEEILNDFNTVS